MECLVMHVHIYFVPAGFPNRGDLIWSKVQEHPAVLSDFRLGYLNAASWTDLSAKCRPTSLRAAPGTPSLDDTKTTCVECHFFLFP